MAAISNLVGTQNSVGYGGLFSPSSPKTPLNYGGQTGYGQPTGFGNFLGGLFKAPAQGTSLTGNSPSSLFSNPLQQTNPLNLNPSQQFSTTQPLNVNQAFQSGGLTTNSAPTVPIASRFGGTSTTDYSALNPNGQNTQSNTGLTQDHISGLISTVQGLQKSLNDYSKQSSQGQNQNSNGTASTIFPSAYGQSPTTYSSDPYKNAINTQQAYASGAGNSTVNSAAANLLGISQNQSPAVQQAISNIRGLQQEQTEIANNPNVAADVASSRSQAVTGMINSAQTGLQNALAEQGQQITAGQEAGGLAQAQAGLQQGTAANIATTPGVAPQLGQYGQTYYQFGQDGQGTQGGGMINLSGQPAADVSSLAGAVNSNSISYQSALSQLSSAYGGAVANQLLGAIQKINPSFNVNTQTGTTGAQTDIGATVQNWKSSQNQAENLTTQLGNLINTYNINPQDVNVANSFIQSWATNTSNPQYATAQNLFNDIANTYANILTPTGSSATDYKTQLAQSFISGNMKGQSLLQVLQNMDSQAQAKISGAQSSVSGGNTSGETGSATGGTNDPLGIL